jgi:hypothetical protein
MLSSVFRGRKTRDEVKSRRLDAYLYRSHDEGRD